MPFCLKNMPKITKKTIKKPKKVTKRGKKTQVGILTFGGIDPAQGRILLLVLGIVSMFTLIVVSELTSKNEEVEMAQIAPIRPIAIVKKQTSFEKKATDLVQGYPIAEMTPYILSKDPKVAAFMIAIAKKESAWGKRHPVSDGKDCYNYWGFRLKSEKMGSGGHTCFDTPEQAVDVVAGRLDELVNEENIDSPKSMIVWKCGYGCQDEVKTVSEKKWISDVAMYYSKLEGYL